MKFRVGEEVVPCWCYTEWQLSLVNLWRDRTYRIEETETQNRLNLVIIKVNDKPTRYHEDWFSPRAPTNCPDWYASREKSTSGRIAVA